MDGWKIVTCHAIYKGCSELGEGQRITFFYVREDD